MKIIIMGCGYDSKDSESDIFGLPQEIEDYYHKLKEDEGIAEIVVRIEDGFNLQPCEVWK